MAKAYLVVRIKGQADVPYWANTTLNLLNLEKKYRAIITPASDSIDGMLKKIQHYVSWQEVDASTAKELLDKKGRKTGYKKITELYGVIKEEDDLGQMVKVIERSTFVIDKTGMVRKVWRNIEDLREHPRDVWDFIQKEKN